MYEVMFVLNLKKTWFYSIIYSKIIHSTETYENKIGEEVLYRDY